MTDALLPTGLSVDPFDVRLASLVADLRNLISTNLDVSTNRPTGQLARLFVERLQAAIELIQVDHASWDPDAATGRSLEALCALTGTFKHEATHGHAALSVTLAATTTLPAGSVASVAGDAANRWVTDADVVSTVAGVYPAAATAEQPGDLEAPSGTITVIATPVAGWSAVTNAADAVPGQDEESDTALRLRREVELARGGSTSVDAIRADLMALADQGMISVLVLENDLDVPVSGTPGHCVEAIVWDGTPIIGPPVVPDANVAATLWDSKAGSVRTYGTSLVVHTDDQGNAHAVRFTRVVPLRIVVEVTLTDVAADYVGDAAVADAVEAWAAAELVPGSDAWRSKVTGVAVQLGGVLNVSLVRLAVWPAALAAADLTIDDRQIATIAAADVTVLSTP